MQLKHQTILITGGSSGIGLELARQLAERDNQVIITGRSAERLARAAHSIPGVHPIQSDLADSNAIARLYDEVTSRFPTLNVVVNNAGIMRNIDLFDPRELRDLTTEIEIGLAGPIQMAHRFLPHLRTRDQAAIVNVTSGLAFVPMPLAPVYCAAKAGLHSFTQSLRAQLEGSTVSVFEVAPPGVETPLFRAEFAEEMRHRKGMAVTTLVRHLIDGVEAGKPEIRPGLARVLYTMGRTAPGFMLAQLAKIGPRRVVA